MPSKRLPQRVFLLSPARCGGERIALLLREAATFPLARELRSGRGAPLGDVFSFASGLYFRGKVTYARAFAMPPVGVGRALVITPGAGLVDADVRVRPGDLQAWAAVEIDLRNPGYATPLARDARALAARLRADEEVVLLGSIASGKYTAPLLEAFGPRLLFPESFVGRGDMSRGGLLLRSARSGAELIYVPVQGAMVRGQRPPRLPRLPLPAAAARTPPSAGTIGRRRR